MAFLSIHPAYVPPMPAVARILARYDRESLSGFIEVAIGLLDVMDGDVDEADGANVELSECGPDDIAGDISYPEWHTRGRHKIYRFGAEIGSTAHGLAHVHEDDEDGDPYHDPLDFGEDNATTATMATLPIYSIDQRLGPINETAATNAHKAAQRDGGQQ